MEPKDIPTPEQVHGELIKRAEPFRIQALRVISAIGFILIAAGSVDLNGLKQFLPDNVAAWFVAIGAMMAGLKQVLLIVGDFLDDYKMNRSFKLGLILLPFLALGILTGLPSCGFSGVGVSVTPEGELYAKRTDENGNLYHVWFTFGEDGRELQKVVSLWTNSEGVELEATYFFESKARQIRYREGPDSGWIAWSSKSGIILDGIPSEVQIEAD